jgi:lysophospholipase L1-like esterase
LKQILVYGDSLAWGIVPLTRQRLRFDERWPGVLENALLAAGTRVRVIEDCLNGRRTVWDDPFKPGRNGLVGLAQRIESCSPLALVVVALGTNDFQSMHPHDAWMSGQGVAALVRAIRTAPIEPGMPVPPVLIVAPPPIGAPAGAIAPKFAGGGAKCTGLADELARVAAEEACAFFDAGAVIAASAADGVHLDAAAHRTLGSALADVVLPIVGAGGRATEVTSC